MDDITCTLEVCDIEIDVYDGQKLKLFIFPGQIQAVSRTFTYLYCIVFHILNELLYKIYYVNIKLRDLKHRSRDSTRPVLKLMVYTNENLFLYCAYEFWALQTLRL